MATSAYEYALNLLTARPYSERNLRRKLVRREFPVAEIDAAMGRLLAAGLIDDRRYAEQFARSRFLSGGSSRRRLQQQLYTRGVPGKVADAAIDEVIDKEAVDLQEMAVRAARKKLATLSGLDSLTIRRRLYGHLARAGHSPDMIRLVMTRVLGGD